MRARTVYISFLFTILAAPAIILADEATSTPPADTTPPVITAPADQYFATTTFPALPTLVPATALDDIDPSPVITYSPLSFALGTTSVIWTASDASGNSATTSSSVIITEEATTTPYIPLVIEGSVDVPSTCTVADKDALEHSYETASTTAYLGICALSAALESGLLTSVGFSNAFPDLGLFVETINERQADPSSEFWALIYNGNFASTGITSLPVIAGDTLVFELQDFSSNVLGDRLTLHVTSLVSTSTATSTPPAEPPAPSTGGGGGNSPTQFQIPSALAYLSTTQNPDGSYSSSMSTDWVALALAASDPLTGQAGEAKTKLRNHLLVATPQMAVITDYERHAMALMALGVNPYNGTPIDYVTPIVNSFDGTQIGDASLVSDDIFGVLVLMHAGYSPMDSIIQKSGAFILAQQKQNGSWDNSADMTAAAVQITGLLFGTPGLSASALGAAQGRGSGFLRATQNANGSWNVVPGQESVDSTSWVQTMINAIPVNPNHPSAPWRSTGGFLPTEYIAFQQLPDGGVRPSITSAGSSVLSTAYAVVATSQKHWLNTMQRFQKPSAPSAQSASAGGGGGGSSGLVLGVATTTAATSTPATSATATSTEAIATSTPAVATSTPIVASSTPVTPKPAPKKIVAPKAKPATPPAPQTLPEAAAPSGAETIKPAQSGFVTMIIKFFTKIFGFF